MAPAAAADAPPTNDLFLARDACGGSDPANPRLSPDLGNFTDGCGSVVGVETATTTFPSATGPLQTLDTARKVYIAIQSGDFSGAGLGIGPQTITVKLTGRDAKSKVVTLGTASDTRDAQTMLRGANYTAEFELPLKANQAGPFKAYTLTLSVGGSQFGGYVDYGGGSFVSIPIAPATTKRAVNGR